MSRFDVVIYGRYSDAMRYCAFCNDSKTGQSLRRRATHYCSRCGKGGCKFHHLLGASCIVRMPIVSGPQGVGLWRVVS